MQDSKSVGKTLYDMHLSRYGQCVDEMKMHKLMYYAQKESLISTDNLLFDEKFYGWRYGPVLMSVRNEYKKTTPYFNVEPTNDDYTKNILQKTLDEYGYRDGWSLSRISHDEISWKHARRGLSPKDNGNNELQENFMRVDALKEKSFREYVERCKKNENEQPPVVL